MHRCALVGLGVLTWAATFWLAVAGRCDEPHANAPASYHRAPDALVAKPSTPYVTRPGSGDSYGYGLIVSDYRGVRVLQHGGSRSGYGSTIRMAPEQQMAVIILANRTGSSLPRTAAKALELMLPLAASTPKKRVGEPPLSADEMERLTGKYSNHRQTVELYVEAGKLLLRRIAGDDANGSSSELHKVDENTFAIGAGQNNQEGASTNQVIVVRGDAGPPEYICLSGRALRRQTAP